MKKREFLRRLDDGLAGLSDQERDNILDYYEELISDQMEDGMPEDQAVHSLGSIESILTKIGVNKRGRRERENSTTSYYPTYDKEKKKSGGGNVLLFLFWIMIIIISFPIWISILAVFFAIMVSGGALLVAGLVTVVVALCTIGESVVLSLFGAGAGLIIAGIGLVLIPVCIKFTKWVWKLIVASFGYTRKLMGCN